MTKPGTLSPKKRQTKYHLETLHRGWRAVQELYPNTELFVLAMIEHTKDLAELHGVTLNADNMEDDE